MSTFLHSFLRRHHGLVEPKRAEPSWEVAPSLVETDDRMAADYYMTFLEYHSNLSLISSRGPTGVFHPLLFFSSLTFSLSLSLEFTLSTFSRYRTRLSLSLAARGSDVEIGDRNDKHFVLLSFFNPTINPRVGQFDSQTIFSSHIWKRMR